MKRNRIFFSVGGQFKCSPKDQAPTPHLESQVVDDQWDEYDPVDRVMGGNKNDSISTKAYDEQECTKSYDSKASKQNLTFGCSQSNSGNEITKEAKQGSSRGFSAREWPINGGLDTGTESCSYTELVITGHADGSIRFWDGSSTTMQALYKIKTSKFFERNKKILFLKFI